MIESAKGGSVVTPGDAKALKEVILDYYNHPDMAKEHGRNAHKYVEKNFNRKKIAANLFIYFSTITDS